MAMNVRDYVGPDVATGQFTSAATPVLVTETLHRQPKMVELWPDNTATNPLKYEKFGDDGTTNNLQSGGAETAKNYALVADTSGIAITATGFTFAAAAQTASKKVVWRAWF